MKSNRQIEVFSTAPQSSRIPQEQFRSHVVDVARWSEEFGCKGILVYCDNSLVDPWLVSQLIIESTEALCPLVAIQPVYMHPYSVAKMVASLAFLYRRRVYLNMVAGGFKNDLIALDDQTPHDKRYERLVEYTTIISRLLSSSASVTYHGEFYRIENLRMTPGLPPELMPGIFISGSSEAGLQAARSIGATAVQYPRPAAECAQDERPEDIETGIRVGIIARKSEEEAWATANERFPEDRKGELTHQLAMKTSDSLWHHQLSQAAQNSRDPRSVYWLRPFEMYKTFCPYLVGTYDQVAEEFSRYLALGHTSVILDIPPSREELQHVKIVMDEVAHGVSYEAAA
jgi:alkanesulfonate monooxygenase